MIRLDFSRVTLISLMDLFCEMDKMEFFLRKGVTEFLFDI